MITFGSSAAFSTAAAKSIIACYQLLPNLLTTNYKTSYYQ
jgi:hypothetical protein